MRTWTKAHKQHHSEALKAAWVRRKARQAPAKTTNDVLEVRRTRQKADTDLQLSASNQRYNKAAIALRLGTLSAQLDMLADSVRAL